MNFYIIIIAAWLGYRVYQAEFIICALCGAIVMFKVHHVATPAYFSRLISVHVSGCAAFLCSSAAIPPVPQDYFFGMNLPYIVTTADSLATFKSSRLTGLLRHLSLHASKHVCHPS